MDSQTHDPAADAAVPELATPKPEAAVEHADATPAPEMSAVTRAFADIESGMRSAARRFGDELSEEHKRLVSEIHELYEQLHHTLHSFRDDGDAAARAMRQACVQALHKLAGHAETPKQ